MRRFVRPGDLVLDIGARQGLFTAHLADLVGPGGAVEAFEPCQPKAAALARVFARRPHVRVHAVALSAVEPEASLCVPHEGGRTSTARDSMEGANSGEGPRERMPVPSQRLDDILADRLRPMTFIKCDVKGQEFAVFWGGAKLLMADRPVVFAEIEQRHMDEPISTRFALFASLGYLGYFLAHGHAPRPVKDFDPARHQVRARGAVYVSTFLFLPKGEDPLADRVSE